MGTRTAGAGRSGLNGAETRAQRKAMERVDRAEKGLRALGIRTAYPNQIPDQMDAARANRTANALERTLGALNEAQAANPDLIMPKEIMLVDHDGVVRGQDWQSVPAAEMFTPDPDTYRLFLNTGCVMDSDRMAGRMGIHDKAGPQFWGDDPMAAARVYMQEDKGEANPRFTSNDPRQVVLHELNHGQADLNLRDMGQDDLVRTYSDPDLKVSTDAHGIPDIGRVGWQAASTHSWHSVGAALGASDHGVSRYAMTSPAEFVAEIGAGLMLGQRYQPAVLGWYEYFGGQQWKAVQ